MTLENRNYEEREKREQEPGASDMQEGRGWDNRKRAKPAAEYEFRYGSGLLRKESEGWPCTLVVTTPRAFETARPYLSPEPAGVALIEWMDWDYLLQSSKELPDDAGLVIGLGGGRAVDAAKIVALDKGLPLITVPAIASTGAIIHGTCAKWRGR
ncbi:MAG: iron-containing alcohol dehydrogenase, partial [Candidatus Latescibacteria bacterium]|nr:iron-containing alcohol dehydrogenase [Candidatus Latescibacterota bacterium]